MIPIWPNSSPPNASAASKAVTVVPILAPSVYGKIFSIVKTPAPTSGIISDVVMELL